jgi:hypothetical protein
MLSGSAHQTSARGTLIQDVDGHRSSEHGRKHESMYAQIMESTIGMVHVSQSNGRIEYALPERGVS